MKERFPQFENQNGSAILIVVVVLLLLTVLGISAIRNTGMELQIAGNSKIYQRNLYAAEGASLEPGRKIETAATNDLKNLTPAWLNAATVGILHPTTVWDNTNSDEAAIDATGQVLYAAVHNGIAQGASLSMGGTNVHDFSLHGRSLKSNGRALITMGYRKRF